MAKDKKLVCFLVVICLAIIIIPLYTKRGAEFGGSDDAGSVMVEEISGNSYEPWFTPIAEKFLGGELPGELESLLFCVQTGIGTFVIAFFLGRFVERKKWTDKYGEESE